MATSTIESIGSKTNEAPPKRGRFSTTLRAAGAVLALSATGAAVTNAATESRAPEPRVESATKPKQQLADTGINYSPLPMESLSVIPGTQIKAIVDFTAAVQLEQQKQAVGNLISSIAAQEEADRQAAAAQQAIRNAQAIYHESNPGDFLSCVRDRESGGNYGIYNAGGSGAAGAYQFMPGTWNGIAASSGRPDLVGVDPAQASPADQDAMAQALYAQQGEAPWAGGNYDC